MNGSFIVIDETYGFPASLLTRSNSIWKNVPAAGILRIDTREITLFRNRIDARAAINRTRDYDRGRGREVSQYLIGRAKFDADGGAR